MPWQANYEPLPSSLVKGGVWPKRLLARYLLLDCLGLVAGGDRHWGGGGDLGGCWYCVERNKRKQPCLRKRTVSYLRPVAFLGGTEVLCWKNRKPGFPGPARPLAGHLPQLPPILIASASHQLLSCLSSFGPPLCQAVCQRPQHGDRTLLPRGRYLTEPLLSTLLTALSLTGTASLLMPSSMGLQSLREDH